MHLFDGLIHGRYWSLLVSLLLFLIIAPSIQNHPVLNFLLPLLIIIILLSALRAVVSNRKYFRLAIGLVSIGLVTRVAGHFIVNLPLFLAREFVTIVLLTFTFVQILAAIFKEKEVTYDTIAGAVCVYLLIGFTWGLLYVSIAVLNPGSFAIAGKVIEKFGLEGIREGGIPRFIYFSFITLTTLGYGDITPVAPIVRSLAILEALVGPLYLTVLVARLVGLHISATTK